MKNKGFKIKFLILAWLVVVLLIIISVVVTIIVGETSNTLTIVSIIVSFASFIATSFFSISIYNHNTSLRSQNDEIRRQTNTVSRRGELFRNLQFIAGNYSIIDFVDHVLMYDESDRYIKRLTETNDFTFYLFESGIEKESVLSDIKNYGFVTVKIPIKIVEGKAINKISIHKIKFIKDTGTYNLTPSENETANALILYNENDHRQEAVINLIVKKNSELYNLGELNLYQKIKITLTMESLLNVAISGSVELYFTNPEKIEKSGANKYKINSSQFQLIGKPKLNIGREYEIE
ncbi:MAG: hypothetical protein FWG51_06075 [Firmicutes bacterium]|nr:hypothetical protein [Bacillota bacterium]